MSTPLPFVGVPGPMQRRLSAIVLVGQAPVILFGALTLWGLASAQSNTRATPILVAGCVAAAVSILVAGMLKRPFGVTIGWALQVLMLASVLVEPLAVVAAGVFLALWITALMQGAKMDDLTRRYEREHAQP